MYKKKLLRTYSVQSSVIKHTGSSTSISEDCFTVSKKGSLDEFTSLRHEQIDNKHERESNSKEPEAHNESVPELHGDEYNNQAPFVAQIIASEEIKNQKELKILTPPPESSFPYDTDGYSQHFYNDGRRDSHESESSQSRSSEPRKTREGKDEKLGREKGITVFISTYDIINLPMDEFNDLLTKYRQQDNGMTEEQAVCARDIRRRGKNKNAAQNCRKRANSRIDKLREEVKLQKEKKRRLLRDDSVLDDELRQAKQLDSELSHRILCDVEMDPKHWTLENDYQSCTVRYKKICPEFEQERVSPAKPLGFAREHQQTLPRPLPYRPLPQVVLEKVPPNHAQNHHIQHRPYYSYGLQPAVSLFPVMPQAAVSLYPVPRFFSHSSHSHPNPHPLNHESEMRDRINYRRSIDRHHYTNYPPRRVQPEETVIKEEIPEDLSHHSK